LPNADAPRPANPIELRKINERNSGLGFHAPDSVREVRAIAMLLLIRVNAQ